jgi:hypothetical protein
MAAQAAPQLGFVFALTPALASQGPINYSTADGMKLWRAAVEPLQKDPYAGDPHSLKVFLSNLSDRSMQYGWSDILLIPEDIADEHTEYNDLLTNYGKVTLSQIVDHAVTYADTDTRTAQNSMMLYQCLANSISKEVKAKTMLRQNEYYVGTNPCGAAYLKIIIREAQIDTRATVLHIRGKLSSLDSYISTISFDIIKFNEYVKDLIDSLAARGEITQDLLANLFKAYKSVKDRDFITYIKKKEDEYEEGQDVDVDMLMLQASNKYKTMIQTGTWNAPSPEEEKILALETQLERLKKKKETPFKDKKGGRDGKKGGKKKDKQRPGKPAWMGKPPPDAHKNKPKMVNGKTYWWCSKHKSWGIHKEADCAGLGLNKKPEADSATAASTPHSALKINKALSAIMEDEE